MRRKLKYDKFDTVKFLKYIKEKKIETIESKHLSEYLECSLRVIQKWSNDIPIDYKLVHGRKMYIWNDGEFEIFEDWYNNREVNKKPRKRVEKVKIRKPPFKTINDIMDQIGIDGEKTLRWKESTKGFIQSYCRKNKIPVETYHGRKYFVISDEIESLMLEKLGNIGVPKRKKLRRPPKVKKPRHKTIKDIVDSIEIIGKGNKVLDRETKIKMIQKYCRLREFPYDYSSGRKQYIITDKIEKIIRNVYKDYKKYL